MNRYPLCTAAVTDSLVPAETTATTRELRSGAVRTFRLAVVYLLPITFNAGVGTRSGFGAATFGFAVAFDEGLALVRVGVGSVVGLVARRSTGSRTGVGMDASTVARSTAGAG